MGNNLFKLFSYLDSIINSNTNEDGMVCFSLTLFNQRIFGAAQTYRVGGGGGGSHFADVSVFV